MKLQFDRYAALRLEIEMKIWGKKSLEQSCCLSTTQCNSIICSGVVPYPLPASVDPSKIGELLLYMYEQLSKQASNNERNTLIIFCLQDITTQS